MTAKDKMTIYPKLSELKDWKGAFTKPYSRMEDVPSYGLSEAEQEGF